MSEENAQNVENKASGDSKASPDFPEKQESKKEAWGYDLYPERRGTFRPKITNILIGKEGKENMDKYKCEKNVYDCIKNSKLSFYSIITSNHCTIILSTI